MTNAAASYAARYSHAGKKNNSSWQFYHAELLSRRRSCWNTDFHAKACKKARPKIEFSEKEQQCTEMYKTERQRVFVIFLNDNSEFHNFRIILKAVLWWTECTTAPCLKHTQSLETYNITLQSDGLKICPKGQYSTNLLGWQVCSIRKRRLNKKSKNWKQNTIYLRYG